MEIFKEIMPYLVSILCAYVSYFVAMKQGKNRLEEIKEIHKTEIEKMEIQLKNKESEMVINTVAQILESTMKNPKVFSNVLKNINMLNNLDNK